MTGLSRSVMSRSCCALVTLLLLVSCTFPGIDDTPGDRIAGCLEALGPTSAVTGLFVEPDDGYAPVLDEVAHAACTVDVSVYLLSDEAVISALAAAVDRGVRVRVTLEEFPFGGGGSQEEVRAQLQASGVEVRWSATDIRFSHAKYLVVDRTVAVVMNMNLTASAFQSNREFGIVTTDPSVVAQAQEIFDRDWAHEAIADPDGPLLVSPTNSREAFLGLIDGAARSIDLYAEVIRDAEVVAALGRAEARGVDVRVIVDQSLDDESQAVAVTLFELGVEIRIADHLYIHAKLMVVDGEEAVVGSQNFTATSLDDNREIAMVVTDALILERCLAIYERDWQRAVPGAPA